MDPKRDKPYFFLGENLKSKIGYKVVLFNKFILKRPDKKQSNFLKFIIEKNYGILTSSSPSIKYEYDFSVFEEPEESIDSLKNRLKAIDNFGLLSILMKGCPGLLHLFYHYRPTKSQEM